METEQNPNTEPNQDQNEAPNPGAPTEDTSNVKVVSAVAYLGILFFVPMLTNPKSEFAMFHANQGLLLLIAGVALNTIGGIIPVLGWFIILPLAGIFTLVLFIMGVVNALQGKMKRLPLIGKFDLINKNQEA